MTPAEPAVTLTPAVRPAWLRFLDKFLVLQSAIRELWLVFMVKFLAIAAYALTNSTLVLWLSSDLGYSDGQAGWLVAAWSVAITAFTLVVGSLTDAIGFRRTFFLGTWICAFARAVLVFTPWRWLALLAGLFPLALGEALGGPVLVASVRRYSNTRQRSVSFSISYTMMNLGFLLAAYIFDKLRHGLGEYGHWGVLGVQISTYRTLFLASLGLELSVLPFIYLLRRGAEATDTGVTLAPQQPKYAGCPLWESIWLTTREGAVEAARLFRGLFRQSGFYRLLGFLLFIAFIKLIYKQLDYVYPKFGVRELGEGAPIGMLVGINYILIIPLAPVVGALTQRFSAYKMVILGGALSAASVFIMALPPAWFQSLAHGWLGDLVGHRYLGLAAAVPVHPYYVMIALFVVLLSFGEAFYSPRVYEYAAAIAPKGQEASYSALSYVPFLVAKVLVGSFSGFLLTNFCPEHGPRHSGTLWLIVALTASIAPVGLVLFRRFIQVQEAGRAE
ncbi:MAG TPA: MFS transporter [Verrucomicrobiae bacterium]|nr:MFS transporter [Verrucomicrobiae bacterium]